MNKKIKKKLIVVLSTCVITPGILVSNIKMIYGYDINQKYLTSLNSTNISVNKLTYNTTEEQKKVAYITIDDGPSKHTQSIIEILKKYDVNATFFMIDRNMKNYPEQVRNILENGNTVGFHTVSHDIHELYKDYDSAKEEFDINRETFYEITGKESKVVRLPYGSKPYTPNESYENLVEAGYKLWDWNIDSQDWKSNPNQIIQNVKDYSKNKDEVVILIHEKKQTVEALEGILKYLINEGYEILPIDENQQAKNYWSDNLCK